MTTLRHHDNHPAPSVQLGEMSQRVCELQAFLGTTYGPWCYTDIARLIEYQQFAGIAADGVPGPVTLAAIEATKRKDGKYEGD